MTPVESPHRLPWIEGTNQPLCHVPWMGTVVVLADGNVNFCCYSSAIVGNVNRESIEEIWNGGIMTSIRQELARHSFPPECRSTSCPLYRGDKLTNLTADIEPHGFRITGTHDPHASIRERLRGTRLRLTIVPGETQMALEVEYRGEPLRADLFLGLEYTDGRIRFLPSLEEFALPAVCGLELRETGSPARIELPPVPGGDPQPSKACAALFAAGSDPNRASNCYWSELLSLAPHPFRAADMLP